MHVVLSCKNLDGLEIIIVYCIRLQALNRESELLSFQNLNPVDPEEVRV